MNNWYVITGAPCSGKTTLLKALAEKGFHIEEESARLYIDEQIALGKTLEDIRGDEEAFQNIVYQHKLERENRLSREELIFFDRGMQDTFAYHWMYDFPISPEMKKNLNNSIYKKVFLLEPVVFEKDYARIESELEVEEIQLLLEKAYKESSNEIVFVPAFNSKEERLDFFFKYLSENESITV